MKSISNFNNSDNLELFAKQIVEGFITGLHKSPYHGFSVEFSEHRLYNPGENTKNIDWKLFARTDKLFSKRYEEETNLRCQLIIDSSSSMYHPNYLNANLENPNKILFSIYASAILINLLKRQRDAVGISFFNEKLDLHTQCRTTSKHHQLLYKELDKLLSINPIKKLKKTFSIEPLHQISKILNKRSLVMIFSDMISDKESLDEQFGAFKHFKHNKHEVILFYLIDGKTELDFEYDNKPYKFIDSETSEEININPNQIKENYKERMNKHINDLKLKCLQYKIDFVKVDITLDFNQVLNSYFIKRKKIL